MKTSTNLRIVHRFIAGFTLVGLTFGLVSCSGNSSESGASDTNVTLTAAASSLNISRDGFAFANFGSANTKEYLNGEDLRLMFGDEVCTNGSATPCALTTEAAAWAQMVNQSRESGHCEGMAVQAANRFTTSASPITADLRNLGDTTHGIIRAFATQFFPSVKEETDIWAKKSLKEILAALGESFSTGALSYTMGLYGEQGGHTVLPISVEYPDADTAKLHVYDTNWPGSDRYVMFDLKKNEWSFSFSGSDPENDPNMWTGGKGEIDLASMSTRTSAASPFGEGESAVKGNFLIIRSTALNWSVKTATENLTATSDATSVRPLRAASGDSLPEYVLSTSATDINVVLPDASSVYVVSAKKVVHITTLGGTTPISVTSDRITSSDAQVKISVASQNLAATVIGLGSDIAITEDSLQVVPSGESKPLVVDSSNPLQTFTTKNGRVVVSEGSDIVKSAATLSATLTQPDTKEGLPPQSQRTLATAPSTTTTVPTTTTTISNSSSPTTPKPASTTATTSVPTPATTAVPQTTVPQSNIVALQYYSNGGSLPTMVNGYSIATMSFKLINTNNQWDTSGTGDCSVTLLPETNGGSLGNATLAGTMGAPASGGVCSITGLVINGTSGSKYRLRISLSNSGATTTLGPFTLY